MSRIIALTESMLSENPHLLLFSYEDQVTPKLCLGTHGRMIRDLHTRNPSPYPFQSPLSSSLPFRSKYANFFESVCGHGKKSDAEPRGPWLADEQSHDTEHGQPETGRWRWWRRRQHARHVSNPADDARSCNCWPVSQTWGLEANADVFIEHSNLWVVQAELVLVVLVVLVQVQIEVREVELRANHSRYVAAYHQSPPSVVSMQNVGHCFDTGMESSEI